MQNSAIDSPRAWLMWSLGALAYTVAVMQRTSFGVASVLATERFSAGASLVSLFVVVQLLTYAAMQVPVGLLTDRFGTRLVLTAGAALMCIGQLDLAFSTSLVSAIIARILVGAGDAMTFTAVLRMLPAWFSPGRIPVLNQLTGMVGQSGQVLSSVPLAAMLGVVGWTSTFAAASAASAGVAVVVLVLLRNAPPGSPQQPVRIAAGLRTQVAAVLRVPATRLAFWIHWMCAFWTMVFALMWGYPFLLRGLGYPQPVAAGLFTVMVIAGIPAGPLIGLLSRRAPLQRTNIALLSSLLAAVPWLAVLLWPGTAPVWLMAIVVAGIAAAGPGSGIGFDIARASNPLHRIGTATGVVIVGGFLAGLVNILVVGVVLDLAGGYTLDAFRWAMATQFVFWGIGVAGAYRARAQARRLDHARGVRYPSLWAVLRREAASWTVQWRNFRAPAETGWAPGQLELGLADGRVIRVAAVLPGTGGQLVAVDVVPSGAPEDWWHQRVDDYLELVGTPELEVGAVEVRCADAASVARVRELIDADLGDREVTLPLEVTARGR
ncbi:MAG: MFS transporter [Propionibacteriaceae bacterium]|nr:MFS transporter [Propionibacteriaceae bacterium]